LPSNQRKGVIFCIYLLPVLTIGADERCRLPFNKGAQP